jgi:hypothetical protein
MPDYSLVPVDYLPEFEGVSFVPVDYDPVSADGTTSRAAAPAQFHDPKLQSASGVDTSSPSYNPSPPPTPPLGIPAPAKGQQPGNLPGPGPTAGVSNSIAAKIREIGSDFYDQSIRQPLRDLGDMGHDLVTDPAYFLHAIGPSLAGLGMSAPIARVGNLRAAERAEEIHNVLGTIAQRLRTTAVLDTDAGRIIAGGTRDLDPIQRAALGQGK